MKKTEPTDFRKLLEPLCRSHDTYTVFSGFVRVMACALACQTREPEYLEEAKRWSKDDLIQMSKALHALVEEMESKPFEDVLGCYYMEFAISTKSQQWGGEFHTPKTICDLMARMTAGDMGDMPKDLPITVMEPACGAGAMILSLAEACAPDVRRRLIVTAVDINQCACDMCFINTTLWHIPCRVIHGDTLRMELWHGWDNFPLMMSPWNRFDKETQGEPPGPQETEKIKAAVVMQQAEFAL